jgi:hypothetical protein
MSTLKLVNYQDMQNSIETYHFGWLQEELNQHIKLHQSVYYVDVNDACFEIMDDEGRCYYAIFRNVAKYEVALKAKDYFLLKDGNRILLNIGGKLYRFLINERKLLSENNPYQKIKCNNANEENSIYFHSISSAAHEIMIVVDNEGIAAINWDNVLWKHSFPDATSGDLELIIIMNNEVLAKYQSIYGNKPRLISFNIQTGHYKDEVFDPTKI